MQEYDRHECADDRDKVYALGISDDLRLSVDYGLTTEAVYISTATACVKGGQVVRVLACASSRAAPRPSHSIPSWVPDWRTQMTFISEKHQAAVASILQRRSDEDTSADGDVDVHGMRLLLRCWIATPCYSTAPCARGRCVYCGLSEALEDSIYDARHEERRAQAKFQAAEAEDQERVIGTEMGHSQVIRSKTQNRKFRPRGRRIEEPSFEPKSAEAILQSYRAETRSLEDRVAHLKGTMRRCHGYGGEDPPAICIMRPLMTAFLLRKCQESTSQDGKPVCRLLGCAFEALLQYPFDDCLDEHPLETICIV